MILNENPEFFANGRDIWKEIKEIFPKTDFLELRISLRKSYEHETLLFGLWDSALSEWLLYNVTRLELLQYFDRRKLIFQQFTL